MTRSEAENVFELLEQMNGSLRGRVVEERWWLVWIIMGLEIVITNGITQWQVWSGVTEIWKFSVIWGAQVVAAYLTIRFLQRRTGGMRSPREAVIWWAWITFLLLSCFVALVNSLLGFPIFTTVPMIPILAAFAFAIMAGTVHLAFITGAVLFAATSVAMCLMPKYQFVIYGAAWFLTLEGLGIYFYPRSAATARPL